MVICKELVFGRICATVWGGGVGFAVGWTA